MIIVPAIPALTTAVQEVLIIPVLPVIPAPVVTPALIQTEKPEKPVILMIIPEKLGMTMEKDGISMTLNLTK